MGKKGQVTIYVIVAMVIVVLGVLIYSFRDVIVTESIPQEVVPIKERFMDCVENSVDLGVKIVESSGGYIETPVKNPSSRYQPFSSILEFAGAEIPYWYYLSGSGIATESVPDIEDIEIELEEYLAEKVMDCNFNDFEEQGFVINLEKSDVSVDIENNYIDINLDTEISISKGDFSSVLRKHDLRYDSYLGLLYEESRNFYDKEMSEYSLVEYGIDVMRLNLPVDGVELTCSPLSWNADELYSNFKDNLELNYIAVNNNGENNDYFNVDFNGDVDLSVMYSSDWPTYFEVNPADRNILVSNPVGNEAGMGILGFCYVPYHFVYDIRYPVLIRLAKSSEVFQFPVVLEINKNVRGKPVLESSLSDDFKNDLCESANTKIKVSLYNSDLEPVDGSVSFECLGATCDLGDTSNGELESLFPQCVNGIISVDAEGYRDSGVTYSTVDSGEVVVVLDREYERSVVLNLGGVKYSGNALITFSSEDYTTSVVYPAQNTVFLSSGNYNVSVMAYSNSSISFPETEKEQCYDVPRSGLLGLAGLTEKECVAVIVPAQTLSNALIGGGSVVYYFDENSLRKSRSIIIDAERLKTPKTIEELQENYIMIEGNLLGVSLA